VTLGLAVALPFATLIGACLALLGAGGSIVAVPVLVFVAGVAPGDAVGMSLAIVGATAVTAAALHAREGRVAWRVAAPFAVAGMAGAIVGARFTRLVPEPALLGAFAALMLLVGGWMLSGGARRLAGRERHAPLATSLAAGFGVGGLTGFLGVGGGFLIVPALMLFAGLPVHRAAATSLVVIAVNASAGLAAHLRHGVPAGATLALTAAAVAGALAGRQLFASASPDALRRGFAVLVTVIGFSILARTLFLAI
jgi:uncharacterized membrane protein YfcA